MWNESEEGILAIDIRVTHGVDIDLHQCRPNMAGRSLEQIHVRLFVDRIIVITNIFMLSLSARASHN